MVQLAQSHLVRKHRPIAARRPDRIRARHQRSSGNMTVVPNRTLPQAGMTVTYDAWNRMTETSVAYGGGTLTYGSYTYDGLNRLVTHARLIPTYGPPANWPTVPREYYYDASWRVVEMFEEPLGPPSPLKRCEWYVWDLRYVDSPVVRFRDGNMDGLSAVDSNDSVIYYCNDANFNVTALVDATDGRVVERYQYNAYGTGQALYGERETAGNPYEPKDFSVRGELYQGDRYLHNLRLFAGMPMIWETAGIQFLYHARNRDYDPNLGRFTGRDPIGYPDGMNGYEYVRSRPTVAVDPMGMATMQPSLEQVLVPGGRRRREGGTPEVHPDVTPWISDDSVPGVPGIISGSVDQYANGNTDDPSYAEAMGPKAYAYDLLRREQLEHINFLYYKITGMDSLFRKANDGLHHAKKFVWLDPGEKSTAAAEWIGTSRRLMQLRTNTMPDTMLHEGVHAYNSSVDRYDNHPETEALAHGVVNMVGALRNSFGVVERELAKNDPDAGKIEDRWGRGWSGISRTVGYTARIHRKLGFSYTLNITSADVIRIHGQFNFKTSCPELARAYNARPGARKACVVFVCDPVPVKTITGGWTIAAPERRLPAVFNGLSGLKVGK